MILIADSGSSKCDWAILDKEGKLTNLENTIGLNPYFHNAEKIASVIESNGTLMGLAEEVTQVYFYGSGSSSKAMQAIVAKGLMQCLPNANVVVEHDLMGAALATYTGEPCITCILGTGSNSVYFDGKEIKEEVPSLAYIIGDEGSGSYFGKQLLRDFFYHKMPSDIADAMHAKYQLTKDVVLDHVYRQPHANVYLASFAMFLSEHRQHPYVLDLLERGIADFLEIHVLCYTNYREVPVHFIGSIAANFEASLRTVAKRMDIQVGTVIKQPIDGLITWHGKIKVTKQTS